MNIVGFTIAIILLSVQCEEYKAAYFKDEMKVQAFSFSQNQEYLVVNQHFLYARGSLFNLPHYIYKKGEKGYRLIGKESYEKVAPRKNNENKQFYGQGKIEISKNGNIFLSKDNDEVVRVFQITKELTHQIQQIFPKGDRVYDFFLSYDGNYLVTTQTKIRYPITNTMYIYKWSGRQFVYNQELPIVTFDPSNIKISAQGNIIISSTLQKQLILFTQKRNNYDSREILFPKNNANQNGSYSISNFGKAQKNGLYTIILLFTEYKGERTILQLRFLQLNINTSQLSLKQTFPIQITNSYYLLTYLTKNGQYFAYANKNGQYVMLYGKKNGRFEFIYKFWNFTQGPSDIYVSQDGSFVAVANKFITSKQQKFNRDSQQIAFFYKCNVANCFQCSWSQVCSECYSDYRKIDGKCFNEDEYFISKQQMEQSKIKSNQSYKSDLRLTIIFFSIALVALFLIIYVCCHCFKKIFNYCGYYFQFGVKKANQLNEEKVSEIKQLSALDHKEKSNKYINQ